MMIMGQTVQAWCAIGINIIIIIIWSVDTHTHT